MAGIYLHIPFCKQACHYCDFHFSTNQHSKTDLLAALCKEIELQKNYLGGMPVQTVYFGGGTPSLLTADEVAGLLTALRRQVFIEPTAEITLEANPDDLDTHRLQGWRAAGITRLSIGIQSFQDDTLRFFRRAHTAAQALDGVRRVRAGGFDHISLDLIYGIPGKTVRDVAYDLEQALLLNPEHISAYALTIEPKTVFGKWAEKKHLFPAPDDAVAAQFEWVMKTLADSGYLHYEISSFCRPGFVSQHNSSYWRGARYLGLGPSAHSYNTHSRQHNLANNARYIKEISAGHVPCTVEILSAAEKINETIYTGLRTMWGCPLEIETEAGTFSLPVHRAPLIEQLIARGHGTTAGSHLLLTPAGKLLADQIAAHFFTDDAEIGALQK